MALICSLWTKPIDCKEGQCACSGGAEQNRAVRYQKSFKEETNHNLILGWGPA